MPLIQPDIIPVILVLHSTSNKILNKTYMLNEAKRYINKFKFLLTVSPFLLFSNLIDLQAYAQNKSNFDEISVTVQIVSINKTFILDALYSSDAKLYISVEELFQILKIPCLANKEADILSGFFENEKRLYEINFVTKQIKDDTKLYNCDKELIKDMGMIFLESSEFEKIFGLYLLFNFRELSIKLTSDFELPVKKIERLEKSRNNIQSNSFTQTLIDTTIRRDYHLFQYGTIDWSVMSTQVKNNPIESRYNFSLGSEILFGEANLFLNISDNYKQDPRLQQFTWRWVDNDKKIIRQMQLGNVNSNTISSIYAPVHGFSVSNTPTTLKIAKGEYIINDVTKPDWLVELYINNALINFTKADAAGYFTFRIPIIYGYTLMKLKFYGPMGEERSEERIINIPVSFMPPGNFEYKLNGGFLQDNNDSYVGRGEGRYGVNRNITIGGGIEYLSSSSYSNSISFVNTSILITPRLNLSSEYDHKVRTKVLLNYYLLSNVLFEINYIKYAKGQKAILFNYLEERKLGLIFPLHISNVYIGSRLSFKQNIYKNFTYNMAESMFSTTYHQFNVNLSAYANWIDNKSVYIYSAIALSFRLPKSLIFRPSSQFNVSNRELTSIKFELEKKVSKAGYGTVSYEKNINTNYKSFNISFKYDLNFAQANISVRNISQDISLMENIRGNLTFDAKNNRTFASQSSMVGRGGIAFIAYVDINQNGIYDPGEKKAKGLLVNVNGVGQPTYSNKDSILRVRGLEPFVYYNVELDDKDFEFITWRIKKKNYSILIDPNQFKTIEIPVTPVAEITGTILFDDDTIQKGKGRVAVIIYNKDGSIATKIISESDGYISYLGLLPGEYYAKIDPVQLERLQMGVKPVQLNFTIKAKEEGDVFNGLDFVLKNIKSK
ncbi:MAG: hypothetical protein NTZ33_14715 [Bacteroidetes bacterium]|nr:hypothetical protein [Bacteroidota bacterium]